MKVHEETWYVEFGSVMVQVGSTRGGDDFVMATGGKSSRTARHTLASAAPDMARALLAVLSDHSHLPDCGYSGYPDHECMSACADARAALKKAGVL